MFFVAPVSANAQPDYVALAMVVVLLGIVAYLAVRKYLCKKAKAREVPVPVTPPAAPAPVRTAPGSAGQVKLHDVEPKVAAMLMCIVADKLQKPLNELRFISIKEVK